MDELEGHRFQSLEHDLDELEDAAETIAAEAGELLASYAAFEEWERGQSPPAPPIGET